MVASCYGAFMLIRSCGTIPRLRAECARVNWSKIQFQRQIQKPGETVAPLPCVLLGGLARKTVERHDIVRTLGVTDLPGARQAHPNPDVPATTHRAPNVNAFEAVQWVRPFETERASLPHGSGASIELDAVDVGQCLEAK